MPKLRGYLKKHREYDHIISSEVFATWSYTAARVCPERTVIWHELAKHNRMMHEMPSRVWYHLVAGLFTSRVTVIPRSLAAAEFIGQFVDRVSDTVIDHGVNLEGMEPVCARQKKNRFVVVSPLLERKRIDRTIDCFARFVDKGYQDYKLYIIGSGELEQELRDKAVRLGLTDHVVFGGQLTHDRLLPMVAQSRALLVSPERIITWCPSQRASRWERRWSPRRCPITPATSPERVWASCRMTGTPIRWYRSVRITTYMWIIALHIGRNFQMFTVPGSFLRCLEYRRGQERKMGSI